MTESEKWRVVGRMLDLVVTRIRLSWRFAVPGFARAMGWLHERQHAHAMALGGAS
jgi:hypothetical protein